MAAPEPRPDQRILVDAEVTERPRDLLGARQAAPTAAMRRLVADIGAAEMHAADRAMHALARAGLAELAERPASTLGLLARKRLELARALAADPVVLLLDEVAGGLTEAETGELCAVLDAIRAAGVALVWVEHGVTSLAGFVDRLLALDRGRVVAVGRPDEVLADPEVQRTYLGDDAARMASTEAEIEAETEAAAEASAGPPGEVTS